MGRLFGTDGIRGPANKYPMSPDLVLRLGQAIGLYFRQSFPRPKILIGKDTRRSGYMLEQALASGICSVGVDVLFLGPLPTPGIAYLTRGMRACAGIVISASHNPYEDNGIKIFSATGYKLPDEIEDQLEQMIHGDWSKISFPMGKEIGRAKRIDDAVGQYAVFLKERFPKHLTLDGLKIVLDCANGAAYKVAPKVFEELGAEVILQGVEPNGFNINADCGALHPKKMQEAVTKNGAQLGIALDGDADRLIVVDDKGKMIDGDQVLAICGHHMKRSATLKKDTVVATVMSNMGLDISLGKSQIRVIRTQVGDRYVVEEMRRGDYNLGGEQSGHLIFKDSSTTGDGILAALQLLEIVQETGRPVSELKQCLELLPQVLKNIKVAKKVPLEKLPDLQRELEQCELKLGATGRVMFRYSGTENLARIMVEGQDPKQIETMASNLADLTQELIARV